MVRSDYTITRRCALYTPGHNVHFIQARLAWDNPAAYVRSEVLAIADDVIVAVTEHGVVHRFRNHDLERFRRIVRDFGRDVTICDKGILRIDRSGGGGFMFCVAPDDGRRLAPCLDPDAVPPPPSDLSSEKLAKYLIERFGAEGGGAVWL